MKKIIWLTGLAILLLAGGIEGHETLDTGAGTSDVGIQEKTGQFIPPDIILQDEAGRKVKMGDMFGKPMILTLIYYTCDRICPQMMEGLAVALPRLAKKAGKDFRVVTVSFDVQDTPQVARDARKNYLKAAGASFPADAWPFLMGDRANIQRLTESVGFRFKKDVPQGFIHPVVLIFLSPDGKISRYFSVTKYEYGAPYPINFSSFELNLALEEAAQGKPVTELRKAVLYCFSHEPPGQSKFFYFIGVAGLVTLAVMISFFVYLQVRAKKIREDGPL